MDKRSPDDIRKSIKSLVEEAENVSIDDGLSDNSSPSKEKVVKSKLNLYSILKKLKSEFQNIKKLSLKNLKSISKS